MPVIFEFLCLDVRLRLSETCRACRRDELEEVRAHKSRRRQMQALVEVVKGLFMDGSDLSAANQALKDALYRLIFAESLGG